jgi:predicted methyltransferase
MLYVAQRPADPASPYVSNVLSDYQAKLVARPDLYGKVILTTLGASEGGIVPPASCDLVVAIDNLHGWLNLGLAPGAFAAIHGALKPDGIFGVVAHRADPAKPRDPRATNGYVNEQFAIELIEAAGFELVARSELNANPRDTRDYEQGAWALPPDLRQGNRERAKFQAIGEPDRFTLKFRKR